MSKTYTIALEFLDHPVELGCGGAGGKNRSFRAAPNYRAHTGPGICLDVKNIWGWDILEW
jgi:hypothetical protein